MAVGEHMGIVGVIVLEVIDDHGAVVDRRECHNLLTSGGLAALASAINWSGISDQAANMGLNAPYSLTPVYGAVGTGSTAVASTDVALTSELARTVVSQATGVSGQVSWAFFFGSSQAVGTIAEAGAFASGTVASGSGILLDHVLISPSLSKTSSQTMTMQVTFTLVNG